MADNQYDFETIINRRNTNCGKWDTMDQKYGSHDFIHLGVADMDYRAPDAVIDGLRRCVDHGVFGYTDLNDAFYEGIIGWQKRMHDVEISREEIVFCPRINISSSISVETFTKPDEEVIINTPAYGPLFQSIVKNGRKVLKSPLKKEGDTFKIDFEHLEQIVTEKTKLFIMCSPHNPVGRVWTHEELLQAGEFCLRHNLLLFVDEIHGDISAKGITFTSALKLPEEIQNILIQVSSPTKTFNVPGVIISYMVVRNQDLREKVKADIDRIGMHNPSVFAVAAVEKAYTKCDGWYKEMLKYVDENEAYTRAYFKKHLPDFHIYPREGTYLLWLDYKKLNCSEEDLEKWFINEAKVSVYMGTVFQEEGRGYIRLNIASPRKLLEQAYDRMRAVYEKIPGKIK